MAKLWMCDKLLTLMRRAEAEAESAGERSECTGEAWVDVVGAGGMARAGAPEGVGCCDWGRTRGLGGVGAACEGPAALDPDAGTPCCGRWAGGVLDGGALESAMGTSAAGATRCGATRAAAADGGRTGA